MRIKAKKRGDKTEVRVMMKHPMLSYREAKKKGKEANFIVYVTAKNEGAVVYEVPPVSSSPRTPT
jgi:sulfur-oxidizing protein SoxZ